MRPANVHPVTASPRVAAARRHRAIRVGMLAISLGLLPAVWAASLLAPGGPGAIAVVLVAALASWFALGVALFRFRCPGCQGPFHRGARLDLFTTSCVNCGMELGRAARR